MDLNTFSDTLPKFSNIKIDQIESALDKLLQRNLDQIDELLSQSGPLTWENFMSPMEVADDALSQFWSPIGHLNAVMNNDALRKVYENCLPKLSDYGTKISHNKALFDAICSIATSEAYQEFSDAQRKIIDNNLRDFRLAGVALPDGQKHQYADISKKLSELTNKFENNILDATKAWTKLVTDQSELAGIPDLMQEQFRMAAQQKELEGWLITLEMPSYFSVMSYADNRELRKIVYEAYTTRASDQGPNAGEWDNTPVMEEILENRLAVAGLLGFKSYAEKSLATKMVDEPHEVLDFLNHLVEAGLTSAQSEFKALSEFAKAALNIETLSAWDVGYVSEKLRQSRYAISQEELRAYFPESQVVPGLFAIVQKLFGVTIQPLKDADTWHPDVKVYAMLDGSNEIIAAFYFDLYARENKRGGAWMDDCRVRRRLDDGNLQLPVAYVNCNFSGPVGDTPALFKHDDVVTLFHEFGHALQHMLTKIEYAEVSGINGVPWDAVEVASQFLENWAWQRDSMPMISRHYETDEPLPDALFDKMHRAKNFQSAMMMMRQLEFSLFDFELHLCDSPESFKQVQALLDHVRSRVTVVPVPEFNRFQHGFSHIFAGGYAAGYYSYKWAEVMAADAFGLFLEKGIFDDDTAQSFKETFMESGGADEPAKLFEIFRGRPPQVDALLQQSGIVTS